jgi:hypothetical protein
MKYSKEYRLERWVYVEMWDESHGIESHTMSQKIGGRTKGTAIYRAERADESTHFSLVTAVRFMSSPLNSPRPSWSRSYSGVYIPNKKLIVPIFWIIFLIQNIVWTMLCLSLSKGRSLCGKDIIISRSYPNFPVNVCLRSLEHLHQCWEDNI